MILIEIEKLKNAMYNTVIIKLIFIFQTLNIQVFGIYNIKSFFINIQ
jgi:hypothetical protein